MLTRFSRWAGVQVDADQAFDMALNSDRTPRTIILNVDRARRSEGMLTPDNWLPSQGRTWEVCFQEACGFWPTSASVYRSLHLVYEAGMPTRAIYVNELASELASMDACNAVDGLVDMGLLGLRAGLLDAASDEQLRDSLLSTGQELPRIEDHWLPVTTSVLRVLDEHAEWLEDLRNLMTHPSLSAESRERMATEAIGRGHQRPELFAWRAYARLDIQDYPGAEADWTEAIAGGQVGLYGSRGLARLGRASDENNDEARSSYLRDAENDFGEALETDPENGVAWYFRGIARAELGEYAAAEEDLDHSIIIGWEPGLGAARFRRGQVREDQGKHQKAEADFTEAIEQGRDDSDVFNRRANVRMQLKEFRGASEDFSEAIDRGRADAGVYMQRGLARLGTDELEEAEQDFSEAATRDPELADAYYWRGHARVSRENLVDADQDYSRAIELGIETSEAFARRGNLRQSLKRFSEAESDLTQAIELGTDEESVYVQRAFARLQQGKMPAAAKDFTRAIDRGAGDAGIYFFRGIARGADDAAAEADFTVAVEKGFDDIHVYTNRALTRINLGRLKGAREDCEHARELDPDSSTTHERWGDLHLSLREYDYAIACYRAAIGAENEPRLHFALGLAQLLSGRLNEAVATYRLALERATADAAQYAAREIEKWTGHQQDRMALPVANDTKTKILSELKARFVHKRCVGEGRSEEQS